jgi:uncharacterized protein
MRLQTFSVLVVAALLSCCGEQKTATLEDLYTREVRLPDGTRITAEVVTKPFDMSRGMMFRDSLAADRGMLFIHGEPGEFAYWMYQVRIPLDIIWMDANHIITEISADTPPCKSTSSRECPNYGGKVRSLYVLELQAGMAAKHNLKPGDKLSF